MTLTRKWLVAALPNDCTVPIPQTVDPHTSIPEVKVDAAVCGDDGRGSKPSADPLVALAQDLDLPVQSLCIVGDSISHDIACGWWVLP